MEEKKKKKINKADLRIGGHSTFEKLKKNCKTAACDITVISMLRRQNVSRYSR